MDHVLENGLAEHYPELFRNGRAGFSCGDGWFDLIDALCAKIVIHAIDQGLDIRFVDGRQKSGRLDMTVFGADDAILQMIEDAATESLHVCEECGETASNPGWGYARTLCESCSGGRESLPITKDQGP